MPWRSLWRTSPSFQEGEVANVRCTLFSSSLKSVAGCDENYQHTDIVHPAGDNALCSIRVKHFPP